MEPTAIAAPEVQTNLNVVWTLIAGILVFTMQAGFALVETGFTRAKNAANIMMKNLMDFAAGSLAFYILGAALMFWATKASGLLGWGGLGMPTLANGEGTWDWTFLFFQTMFAATAATIVSGAVAERIEFKSYLIYSVIVSAIVYPVSGHWMWGGLAGDGSKGWLELMGFHDFAGSTVVHSVGGWIALAGARDIRGILAAALVEIISLFGYMKGIFGHDVVPLLVTSLVALVFTFYMITDCLAVQGELRHAES